MASIVKLLLGIQATGAETSEKKVRRVSSAVEDLGIKQVRLGQVSASAGRQFGAQQQGLGGLVAAYAGAAATIFALQQSFSALTRAAAAEQTIAGVRALGAAIGESGEVILKTVQEITKSQLTLVETAENVNIALSAGFNTEQIERLSGVALKASRALGRNLSDSLNRVVRGTSKLEPELLDELGIFTRIEPAVQAYAASVGKAATQLTGFERRQAFVNAAIEEGERKFKAINTSIPTAAEALEKLSSSLIDIAFTVGEFLSNHLIPIANFFSSNLTNAVVAFTLVASTVLSKTITELTLKFASVTVSADRFAKALIDASAAKAPQTATALTALNKAVGDLSKSYLESKTKSGQLVRGFIDSGRAAEITAGQIQEITKALEAQKAATIRSLATTEAALQKKIASGKLSDAEIDRANVNLGKHREEIVKQTAALTALDEGQKTISKSTIFWSSAVKGAGRIISGTANIIGNAISIFSRLTFFISVSTLLFNTFAKAFGIDEPVNQFFHNMANVTRQFFGFTEAARLAEEGAKGLAAGLIDLSLAAAGLSNLQEFTVMDSFLGFEFDITFDKAKMASTLRDISSSLESRIRELNNEILQDGSIGETARAVSAKAAKFAQETGITYRQALTQQLLPEVIKKELDFNPVTWTDALALEALEKAIIEFELTKPVAEQIQFLAEASGKAAQEIVKDFEIMNTASGALFKSISAAGEALASFTIKSQEQIEAAAAARQRISFSGDEFYNENQLRQQALDIETKLNEAKAKGLAATSLGVSLEKELLEGKINSEGIARALNAVEVLIKNNREVILQYGTEEEKIQLKLLELQQRRNRIEGDRQIAIEQLNTSLRRSFSSEISAAGNLTGLATAQGNLARDANEARANNIELLGKSLTVFKELNTEQGIFHKFEQLNVSTQQALVGLYIKTAEELKKINDELTKRVVTQEKANITNQLNAELDLMKQQLKIQEALISARNAQFDRDKEIVILQNKLVKIQRESAIAANEAVYDRQIAALENQLANVQGPLSSFFTTDEVANIKIEIETAKFEKIESNIRMQIDALNKDTQARLAILDAELANIEKQKQDTQNRYQNNLNILDAQRTLDLGKAKADEAVALTEVGTTKTRVQILIKEALIFKEHSDALAQILAAHVVGIDNAFKDLSPEERQTEIDKLAEEFVKGIDINIGAAGANAITQLLDLEDKIVEGTQIQIQAANNKYENDKKLANLQRQADLDALNDKQTTLSLEKDILNAESDAKKQAFEDQLKAVNNAFEDAIDNILKTLDKLLVLGNELVKDFNTGFSAGMQRVFSEVLDGTAKFGNVARDMMINILEEMRRTITDELIIQPLIDAFAQLFKYIANALKQAIITSLVASGGPIHLASGGGVGPARMAQGGLRDRVPALLEPGEFVIKKSVVDKVGLGTLREMNATGKSGGDVQVNVINNGTAQEVEDVKPPRFDGEKFVVDVIVRDLQNNGPIRQTMRNRVTR